MSDSLSSDDVSPKNFVTPLKSGKNCQNDADQPSDEQLPMTIL